MTKDPSGWHHCGKCGEIFLATDAAWCPACQRSPIPARKKIQVHTVHGHAFPPRKEFHAQLPAISGGNLVRVDLNSANPEETAEFSRARSERKPKKSYALVKFLIAWLVLLAVLAGVIKWKFQSPIAEVQPVEAEPEIAQKDWHSENYDLFQRAYPSLVKLTAQLYENTAPESVTQWCRSRPRLASIIFNDGVKAAIFRPDAIQLSKQNVIRPSGIPMIETIWSDNRGRQIEMVFAEEDGQWLLDWESYARSSAVPWSVFQGGDEEEEGVFRLLVRERMVQTDYSDLQMSIVFYEPGLLRGSPLGLATPEFLVDRKSREGRLIAAALEARKNNKPLMKSIFPEADPPNTARVTVKIRRSLRGGEKQFTLVEVLACHWMGIDNPGVELTDTP